MTKPTGIDLDTLTVGEFNAMQGATSVWALLYNMKSNYLRDFIAKLSADKSEQVDFSLPLFKIILFCAEHIQEHAKNDPRLINAIKDVEAKNKVMEMLQITGLPQDD